MVASHDNQTLANSGGRGSRRAALRAAEAQQELRPPAPRASRLAPRDGVSLLEVLISMFVLLFGLMGVAAIFPVGNHYAAKSDQYDRGAALADAAMADLKARGLLRPEGWIYPAGASVIDPTTNEFRFTNFNGGHAFVIDPIGAAETDDIYFPFEAEMAVNPWQTAPARLNPPYPPSPPTTQWPIRRVTYLNSLNVKLDARFAGSIFRLRDDLANETPDENDRPGMQRWSVNNNSTPDNPYDDATLVRDFAGSYSWLATVLPVDAPALLGLQPSNPRFGSFLYEVSVAVFHKREDIPSVDTERMVPAAFNAGGELVLYDLNNDPTVIDNAADGIRPGQWIAVTGVHPSSGKLLLKWYRILSLEDETATDQNLFNATGGNYAVRRAMLEGPGWTARDLGAQPQLDNLRAILLPGVVGVTTKTMPLSGDL